VAIPALGLKQRTSSFVFQAMFQFQVPVHLVDFAGVFQVFQSIPYNA
jgi:hypothetical protein